MPATLNKPERKRDMVIDAAGFHVEDPGRLRPRFERGLAEKMMMYALGRTLEPTDDAVLQKIVTDMGTSGHTLKSLIHGIVATRAFRTK